MWWSPPWRRWRSESWPGTCAALLEWDQLDDGFCGVRQVRDRLRLLGEGGKLQRALGERVVAALIHRDDTQRNIDLGTQRIEQRVVFELGDAHGIDRHGQHARQAPDEQN